MDPILFITVSLLVLTIIALLALRFGVDSRPSYRSSEHALALGGVRWEHLSSLTPGFSQAPKVRLVTVDDGASAYPTLAMIDGARRPEAVPFAQDPHADRLERRARQLVDEYWSDTIWLTGLVPDTWFRAVCEALERERLAASRPVVLPIDMGTPVPRSAAPHRSAPDDEAETAIPFASVG